VVDGHLRLKAARKLGNPEVPVILCDEWTEAQVKAFRLMVNRSVTWAVWDEDLLAQGVSPAFALALNQWPAPPICHLTQELLSAQVSSDQLKRERLKGKKTMTTSEFVTTCLHVNRLATRIYFLIFRLVAITAWPSRVMAQPAHSHTQQNQMSKDLQNQALLDRIDLHVGDGIL
jgi:hypothetical protein